MIKFLGHEKFIRSIQQVYQLPFSRFNSIAALGRSSQFISMLIPIALIVVLQDERLMKFRHESVFLIILSVSSRFVTIRFFRNNWPSI